ncbi:recombinase family protein [Paraburkholderia sp. RL17-373-BIF-A]|uniref:recombinase family protein n=1 Tax=Paraburkholderia sp. RL17-373-BIF-A TaxID=3031629 RepID=UPI0038BB1360
MFIRAYLRASTADQNANRAENAIREFAAQQGVRIAAWFRENESGTKLDRPELFNLIEQSEQGDVLLVEQVDRLSRLGESDWNKLRGLLKSKGIRVVALDLPTSYGALKSTDGVESFEGRMLSAVNEMMLDMLAAVARKDLDDRKRRAAEGVARRRAADEDKPAEQKGYQGRRVDADMHANIVELKKAGKSYSDIERLLKVSRPTVARALKLAGMIGAA